MYGPMLDIEDKTIYHARVDAAARHGDNPMLMLASDPDRASAEAVLPRLVALERRWGSIVLGAGPMPCDVRVGEAKLLGPS